MIAGNRGGGFLVGDQPGSGKTRVQKLKIRLMQSQWFSETIISFPVTWANTGIVIPATG